jgi:ABC-type nitrate/sulfonate/bicarbonate transport system permease component
VNVVRDWVPPLFLVALFLAAWQVAASTGFLAETLGLDPLLVPSPSEVAAVLWEDRQILAENALVTLIEVVAGFALALVVGVAAAVGVHLFEPLRRAAYPLAVASQTIPVIVIAPILVVWFGYGIGPKLAIIALICFFPIAVNTLDGLRSVDRDLIGMMRSLDANRRRILTSVELPSALPNLFSGAKIAVAVAVIGAVFGEWVGASEGLGYLILQDNAQLLTDRLFAAVFLLSVMAMLLFGAISLIERFTIRWR